MPNYKAFRQIFGVENNQNVGTNLRCFVMKRRENGGIAATAGVADWLKRPEVCKAHSDWLKLFIMLSL